MKTALFLLFTSIPLFSFSQNVDYTKEYHPYIHLAEMSIIDADYDKALTHYKTAFQRVSIGFARDYYNAILCAIEIRNAF